MTSRAYSLVFSTPNKQYPKNDNKNGTLPPKAIKIPPQQKSSSNTIISNLFGRREFISSGVHLGIFTGYLMPTQFAEAVKGACEFTVSPSGLAFCDLIVGFGPPAAQGQLIKAHYVGKLEDGKVFDSSYSRGKPLTFRVGAGEVIKGWDEGILGTDEIPPMVTGGKRKLRIPPELGYGVRGAGCRGGSCIIPPNSVFFFDVEFVGKV
ncbi:hypothetical protein RND81_05G037200 [Saponaria officinalis]|uniref:peptidylprolyl isomerase n=1 Tax=Saponaria officinalis TaxID=3572 RepID=A0AAW1KQJ8_SAPOF